MMNHDHVNHPQMIRLLPTTRHQATALVADGSFSDLLGREEEPMSDTLVMPPRRYALSFTTGAFPTGEAEVQRLLGYLRQNNKSAGVLGVELAEPTAIYDRSMATETGWKGLLGRGLDIFQRVSGSPFDPPSNHHEYREVEGVGITYLREANQADETDQGMGATP